jgi:hypothetical protein
MVLRGYERVNVAPGLVKVENPWFSGQINFLQEKLYGRLQYILVNISIIVSI